MSRVALLLFSAITLAAAPASSRKKTAVFLVPTGAGADAAQMSMTEHLEAGLALYPGLTVRTNEALLGVPEDEDAQVSLRNGELLFAKGKAAFDARQSEPADRLLHTALPELVNAAAAMKECGHLCDTLAMTAALAHEQGDDEAARKDLLDLLSLRPTYSFDKKRFTQDFLKLQLQVVASRAAQQRGNLTLGSHPGGARWTLDGERGDFTPAASQSLRIGKHLLQLERPGYARFGTVVEVSSVNLDLEPELTPTPECRAYRDLRDALAREAAQEKVGPVMAKLGRRLGLDRVIVGQLDAQAHGNFELRLGYFDLKSATSLGWKKARFQGNEYGQLKQELGRLLSQVLNSEPSTGPRSTRTLEGHHGTEEWNAEDLGGRQNAIEKKKKVRDPLDNVTGTEDW